MLSPTRCWLLHPSPGTSFPMMTVDKTDLSRAWLYFTRSFFLPSLAEVSSEVDSPRPCAHMCVCVLSRGSVRAECQACSQPPGSPMPRPLPR